MSNLASSSATNNDESNNNDNNNNVSFSATLLWKKFHRDAIFSLYSPFVLSMAAGNLPEESFKNYLTQDSYYLNSYYYAYQICTKYKGVDQKIKAKCEKSAEKYDPNIVIPDDLPLATKNYIDFLIHTASGTVEEFKKLANLVESKIPAFTITAMTPCKRLYVFLGMKLEKAMVNPSENRYIHWIQKIASEDDQKSAETTEELVDEAYVKMSKEELQVVEKLYEHGMKLEYGFFQSQLPENQHCVIVPLLNKLKRDGDDDDDDQGHNNNKLHIIIDANSVLAGDTFVSTSNYESLFQDRILEHAPDFFLNNINQGGKINENLLQEAEQSMEVIRDKVAESNGEVILQPYSINFLNKVLLNNEENISIDVIPSGNTEGIDVQANQLNIDDDKNLTAFIGCSIDNWNHLINAKIGIILGINSDLEKKGHEAGISFVSWFDGLVDLQSKYCESLKQLSWKSNVLYTISSWAEIDASILGMF